RTPSAPEFEQGIADLVPALKLFKGFSFSVRCRARSILLSGAQLQSSTQLLSTSRKHRLDERKVLPHPSCPDVLPQFALHRRHLRPFRHYVAELPAGIGNRVSVREHRIPVGQVVTPDWKHFLCDDQVQACYRPGPKPNHTESAICRLLRQNL